MNWLSGDQNGNAPPSVPGRGRTSAVATGRTQIWNTAWAPATNAMFRPSGEIAICAARPVPPAAGPPKAAFSGDGILNLIGLGAGTVEPGISTAPPPVG